MNSFKNHKPLKASSFNFYTASPDMKRNSGSQVVSSYKKRINQDLIIASNDSDIIG